MKTTSILLSLALVFQTVYSKAIDNYSKIIKEQINVTEEDSAFELVKTDNFIYKFHCSEKDDVYCNKLKDDLDFAFTTLSNTFRMYNLFLKKKFFY